MLVTASPRPRQTVSGPTNRTVFLESLDSDADVSVVIVLRQSLNQQQNHSQIVTVVSEWDHDEDDTNLNDWVGAPWIESSVSVLASHIALRQLSFACKA